MLQAEYEYNALGQQVMQRLYAGGVPAQAIHVVHDVFGNRVAEYDAGTSTLLREYVWLGERPIAVVEGGVTY